MLHFENCLLERLCDNLKIQTQDFKFINSWEGHVPKHITVCTKACKQRCEEIKPWMCLSIPSYPILYLCFVFYCLNSFLASLIKKNPVLSNIHFIISQIKSKSSEKLLVLCWLICSISTTVWMSSECPRPQVLLIQIYEPWGTGLHICS